MYVDGCPVTHRARCVVQRRRRRLLLLRPEQSLHSLSTSVGAHSIRACATLLWRLRAPVRPRSRVCTIRYANLRRAGDGSNADVCRPRPRVCPGRRETGIRNCSATIGAQIKMSTHHKATPPAPPSSPGTARTPPRSASRSAYTPRTSPSAHPSLRPRATPRPPSRSSGNSPAWH